LETLALKGTIVVLVISVILSLISLMMSRKWLSGNPDTSARIPHRLDNIAVILIWVALIFLTLSIVSRAFLTGHGPFSNMYEFSVAFSWGIIVMGIYFQWRYKVAMVKVISIVVAIALLIFASTLSSKPVPLVPALQQSYLLSAHVASAIIAYGTFTIGFASAVLYLVQKPRELSWMPSPDILDNMSYHAVVIGFPFLTLLIVLGAVWADIAWGRYWGWDPKETASLITWLLYASYLHARIIRGWRGSKTAILLIIGFAAVIFTFFGNYIFSGLHSYQ